MPFNISQKKKRFGTKGALQIIKFLYKLVNLNGKSTIYLNSRITSVEKKKKKQLYRNLL